jgi:hypothetical protein
MTLTKPTKEEIDYFCEMFPTLSREEVEEILDIIDQPDQLTAEEIAENQRIADGYARRLGGEYNE